MNEKFSDFIVENSINMVDAVNVIIEKLKQWALDAANWMKHVFQVVWENCVSFYQSLKNWVRETFADKKNHKINLFDSKSSIGRELKEILDGAPTISKEDFFKYGDTIAITQDQEGDIRDITEFKTSCGITPDMQKIFDENGGRLAIENC